MFSSLSNLLRNKFSRKDDLSRQVEIARVLDVVRREIKSKLPNEEISVVSLKNKTLTLIVSSSVVANELRMHEHEVVSKLNAEFGARVLEKVIYRF